MEMDRINRNCYDCGGFGHLARNYRNRGKKGRTGEGRRLEYKGNNGQRRMIEEKNKKFSNNLNGNGDLIVSN